VERSRPPLRTLGKHRLPTIIPRDGSQALVFLGLAEDTNKIRIYFTTFSRLFNANSVVAQFELKRAQVAAALRSIAVQFG
jgi:hypothetical protein